MLSISIKRILPSVITILNLLCGFLSVLAAFSGQFKNAAALILLAGVLDGLDGFVARFLKTQSDMGRSFDSFADLVSFGMAPALLMFCWQEINDEASIFMIFLFFLAATFRLSRFNLGINPKKNTYQGLPTMAAAGFLALMILCFEFSLFVFSSWSILFALLVLSFLMVSSFQYASLNMVKKDFLLVFFLLMALTAGDFNHFLFFVGMGFSVYVFQGFFVSLRGAIVKMLKKPQVWRMRSRIQNFQQ